MKPAKLLAALGVILGMSMLSAAEAETFRVTHKSDEPGGYGGADFYDLCPPDMILAQVNASFGDDMNSIAGVCRRFENGKLVGGSFDLPTRGQPGGKRGYVRCKTLMQGIHVAQGRVSIIHHIAGLCRDAKSGKTRVEDVIDTETFGRLTHGGETLFNHPADCGPGAFAVGIFGGHGAAIDRLGVICGTVNEQANVPLGNAVDEVAKDLHDDMKRAGQPLEVGADDGVDDDGGNDAGGGGGGIGGGSGRANVATTIYDMPGGTDVAYLNEDDVVTIVQCGEPENWCKISQPTSGWVWGPEIDR